MAKLYNLAAMTVASTGPGTLTLGSAATILGVLYLSFAAAGVSDGETVAYSIADVGGSENGTGVYTAAGTTLTRIPVRSTNGNAAINMTAAAIVRISPAKEDLANLRENNTFTGTQTINPTTATINPGLVVTQTGPSSGTSPGPVLFNTLTITNPGVASSTTGIDAFGQIKQQVVGFRINYASSGVGPNNGAFGAANWVTGLTDAYGAAVGVATPSNLAGHDLWGHIGYAMIFAGGAVNVAVAVEGEIGVATGATTNYRMGVSANSQSAVQGSVLDAAFCANTISNVLPGGGATTPFQHLMALSSNVYGSSQFPITTTGDFFFSEAAGTVAHFANLPNVTVTGNILSFPSMAIAGNGRAVFGNAAANLPSTGIIVYAASGSGNVQIFGGVNGAAGAGGITAQDSSLNNTLYSGVVEASFVGNRFGTAQANFAELVASGSTNAGLIIGTVTAVPVIFGTNNIERARVTSAGLFNIGPNIAPDTLLTLNSNTGTGVASSNIGGTAQLHLMAPDGVIGGQVADVYGAQGVLVNRHSSGTQASKSPSAATTFTWSIAAQHWDTVDYFTSAGIDFGTINLQSATDHGGFLRVRTVASGTTTYAERLRVQLGLGVGTTSDPGVGLIYTNSALFMNRSKTSWNNGAAAAAGTLTNAPTAGNPTKWIPVDDNGTTRYIPAW